jgi:hypothetical protein
MKRYSMSEIRLIINQLQCLVDVAMFQRAFINIASFYSSFECQDVGVLVDLRMLELAKKNGR